MRKINHILVLFLLLILSSCTVSKYIPQPEAPQTYTMNLSLVEEPTPNKYTNLDYGIRLNIQDGRAKKSLIQLYDASAINVPEVYVNPGIGSFIKESMRRYMRTMGFNLDADVATDYLLQVSVKEFHTDYLSGIGWNGTVIMEISVSDHSRIQVYPTVEVIGRASMNASAKSLVDANKVLNQAYVNALKDVDWDRIAYFLHRAGSPKQEANKKVIGDGNTALEHLVVHWNVNSRPQGADIFWRVISKTPDVKNQNYKYLETTPYEGNETLNIKGLSSNNAGLVQIEIKVEKQGYYSQTKKYDVLSLIDDSDVSYMFRLVKEEE